MFKLCDIYARPKKKLRFCFCQLFFAISKLKINNLLIVFTSLCDENHKTQPANPATKPADTKLFAFQFLG